jgi:VIT1/CCC1 family predicted Fe2+/Mn2+ transporter
MPSTPLPADLRAREELYHMRIDPHRQASSLSDVILGGQDGIVNVLGVILGVAAATFDARIVIVAGLAATFAESVSMAAVAFTSTVADSDFYQAERERERRHVEEVPHLEREKVRRIYAAKGFDGDLLEGIVAKITSDPDVWVNVMMAEEHHLTPTSRKAAAKSALVVGLAAMVGSLIPLLPFALLGVGASMIVSVVLTAAVLFGVGAYKAKVMVGNPGRSGLEMAVIGTLSALVGYAVGAILKLPPTV